MDRLQIDPAAIKTMRRTSTPSAFVALLSWAMIGCYAGGDRSMGAGSIDLLRLFVEQMEVNVTETQAKIYPFVRDGQRRQTITLIANAEIATPKITIPPQAKLVFALGMPFNLGDGAQARVYFQSGGTRELLFARYLDPARRRADRSWQDVSVDLSAYAGRSGRIVLEAAGTTGDLTADWIGWAEPRIQSRAQVRP